MGGPEGGNRALEGAEVGSSGATAAPAGPSHGKSLADKWFEQRRKNKGNRPTRRVEANEMEGGGGGPRRVLEGASLDTGGAAAPQPRDVMISYSWSINKDTVGLIAKKLGDAGLKVWLDQEDMYGDILDRMEEGIRLSTVILICFSEPYSKSFNCETEAKFARKNRKTIVPVRMQSDYNPTGWLSAILLEKLYYDVSTVDNYVKNLPGLMRELARHIDDAKAEKLRNAASSNVGPLPASHVGTTASRTDPPAAGSPYDPEKLGLIAKWGSDKVLEWLDGEKLSHLKDR